MPRGDLWSKMDARARRRMDELKRSDIPPEAGVYALYRDGSAIYVGKAKSLRQRVGKSHGGRGRVMTSSAFRRNVAECLGIATADDIYNRRYQPTDEEVNRIREFVEECEVSWTACETPAAAVALETLMKKEWLPPLTKV